MDELKKLKFHVAWSAEDNEWVATCDAFPSMSWLDADPSTALRRMMELALRELQVADG